MKKYIVLLLILLCTACSAKPSGEAFRLIQATDLHYLANTLYDDGPLFRGIEQNGDGKYISKGDTLLDELEAFSSAEDTALLLTGDLTFNGEKASHLALIERLQRLEQQGTTVYVLPGNHDMKTHAWKLTGAKEQKIESIDPSSFKTLYGAFGYDDAFSRDEASFSYAAYLSTDTVLLALDVNTKQAPYRVHDETMRWLKQVLNTLRHKKLKYISVSHQNLFVHNQRFVSGYQFERAQEVAELFALYPPLVHLSGHLHIQHQVEQGAVTEIATSSIAIYPHHIAVVTPTGYRAQPLMNDDFLRSSLAFYRQTAQNRTLHHLAESAVPQAEQSLMAQASAEANALYFSGHLEKLATLNGHPGIALWQKYKEAGMSAYILELLEELPYDHTKKDFYENSDSNGHR